MFATIKINGKDVNLKASLYSNIIYKSAFGSNMLTDMAIAGKSGEILLAERKSDTEESNAAQEVSDIEKIEAAEVVRQIGYQAIWALAKEADNTILAFPEWLSNIEDIDFNAAYTTAANLIVDAQKIDRKNV